MGEIDPLALEVTDELNNEAEKQRLEDSASATWEHQELAKVKIRVVRGHRDAVKSCEFCEGGERILTSSHDKTAVLWNRETGTSLHTYQAHTDKLCQARASPTHRWFVSVGWDKKVCLWDTETGQVKWRGEHGGIVTCCGFSHNGKLVVTGSDLDNTVCIWEAESGRLLQKITNLHSSTITSVRFTCLDDRVVTTSMDQTAKFYDCRSNTVTLSLNTDRSVHSNVISSTAISNNSHQMATVSWDKSVAIWDISTGMFRSKGPLKLEKAHEGSISSCSFSSDATGSMLVTGGYDNTVALWDIDTMTQKLRLQDGTLRLWNIEDSDKIPVVLANTKSIGLKMFKCSSCDKPFSASQAEMKESTLCVFCRLQAPERNISLILG